MRSDAKSKFIEKSPDIVVSASAFLNDKKTPKEAATTKQDDTRMITG